MKFSSLALLGAVTSTASAYRGIQTGPLAGSSYASNMLYDSDTRKVYLVGNTYDPNIVQDEASSQAASESSCFLTSVDTTRINRGWSSANTYGDSQILESCQTLGMINPYSLVVLGNSEPNGLYANDFSKLSGFAMALDKSNLDVSSGTPLASFAPTKIPYPVAVATDGRSDMYIVSLLSIDDHPSNSAMSSSFPNWIMAQKYGSSFDMSVMKVSSEKDIVSGTPSLITKWWKQFPVESESNGVKPRVYIGGILLKNDFLVVAGSTRGHGPSYGRASGDDEDGFLTLLNPSSGDLLQNQKSQSRIGTSEDDLITGICDNPNDPDSFYIVGATRGDIDGVQDNQRDIQPNSLQGFIKKVSVGTLHGIWTIQWGAANGFAETSAYALGCAVHGNTVYVAGNVENGAGMVQGFETQDSKGGDDIWVARVTDSGIHYAVNWMQQVGTPGDDHLARYGGIAADAEGNAVLYGDTTGSMFRSRGNEGSVSDIFVMTVDKDDTAPFAPVAAPWSTSGADLSASGELFAIQSGPSTGNSYASSMVYDDASDEVYLMGNTYDPKFGSGSNWHGASSESSCFMTPMDLGNRGDVFSSTHVIGDPNVLESCRGLGMLSEESLVLLGNSEPGGIHSNENYKMTGFASVLDKGTFQNEASSPMSMSSRTKIPYPVSAVSDNKSSMYMVALTSTDDEFSSAYSSVSTKQFPDWVRNEKYGSSFDMSVVKLSYAQSEPDGNTAGFTTLLPEWTHEFPVDSESNGVVPRVYIGGLILKNDEFLIAAGSTRGMGRGYGSAWGDDEDGFVSLIDLQTGDLVQNRKNQERIGSSEDDLITGICDNPNDPNSFYVVGATRGEMRHGTQHELKVKNNSLKAFIKKINLNSLHGFWTAQWGALDNDLETSAYALGCTVIGDTVYVAGNVNNGAGMVQGYDLLESQGGDDVWVASLTDYGNDYDVNWLQQVGSAGDESLARYGGIVTDSNGNAVIYGDTTGSMFRSHRDYDRGNSDVFVMSLHRANGYHVKPAGDASGAIGGGNSFSLPPLDGPSAAVVALIVIVLVLGCCLCMCCRRRASRKRTELEQSLAHAEKSLAMAQSYRDNPAADESNGDETLEFEQQQQQQQQRIEII